RCIERGVAVVLGGVFATGVLADPIARATFDYGPVPPAVAGIVDAMRGVCQAHGLPLGAAALQHALRHPAVTSVVVGAHSTDEVAEDLRWASLPIPDRLWSEL